MTTTPTNEGNGDRDAGVREDLPERGPETTELPNGGHGGIQPGVEVQEAPEGNPDDADVKDLENTTDTNDGDDGETKRSV